MKVSNAVTFHQDANYHSNEMTPYHTPFCITPNNLPSGIILDIQRRNLGLHIVVLTMANFKKVFESVIEKNASEVSRCQDTTKTKLF